MAAVVSGVLAAGFFVLALVMWGGKSNAEQALKAKETENKEIARDNERNLPDVRALLQEASKANKSLVKLLAEKNAQLAEKISGNAGNTPEQLLAAINAASGPEGAPLLGSFTATKQQLASALRDKAAADDARKNAEAKLQEVDARLKAMNEALQKTLAGATADVNDVKKQTEGYRADVNKTIGGMNARVEEIKQQAESDRVALTQQIATLEQQKQIIEAQLKELRASKGKEQLRPGDEFALVDGTVVANDPADPRVVFIDRGREHRVVLGMTFEVYSDSSEIIADRDTGEYRTGKAALEVIRIDRDQSMCRVIRPRGRADVRKGDVIVNAIYDPKKTYSFLVVGNFDAQGYGTATPEGAGDVKALIDGWGGKVVNELRGDIDFVVLGARPVVPPQPPPDAAIGTITEYLRLNREAQKYDDLFKQAVSASIPVLNQNRLFTLIGR